MVEFQEERLNAVQSAHKVIVKAGTRLVIDRAAISRLIDGIAQLRSTGKKVLLVTSGAVGMGMELAGMTTRPRQLAQKQALAAMGQTRLMLIYSEEAAKRGFRVAQLLLTASDLRSRERYLNVMNCINALWEKNILPIVNENDSVSVSELKFGDNDTLAGMLTALTGAELTILLTTVDGLRDRNADDTLGARISVVPRLTEKIKALAGGTDNSDFSVGGMSSKLIAADLATASGACLWIADGREKGISSRILSGADTGTLFLPRKNRIPGRKRWLGFFSRVSGTLTIDDGAVSALCERGKSLLPSGIIAVTGDFKRGDTVEICDQNNVAIARGLCSFSAEDCRKICGRRSEEVVAILGDEVEVEAVHRDHLMVIER